MIVYGPWGCGRCANCRMGMENYCENPGQGRTRRARARRRHGALPGRPIHALSVPSGALDPREAAPLTDAALTSYHAVKRSLHLLGPGSTAVVIGAGGLGQMAIQVLKALTAAATVVAVDTSADKLETAKRMGADETLLSGDGASSGSRTSPAARAPSSSSTWSVSSRRLRWPRRSRGCSAT